MRTKHSPVSYSCLFILTFSIYSLTALFDQAWAWTDDTTINTKVGPAGYGQYNPTLTNDGAGGVIITWFDENYEIYAQRVSASGELLWGEGGVSISDLNDSLQEYPVIASDGSGGAIIAWQDNRYGTYDIFAQWINASGGILWPLNGIPICAATERQSEPIIISDRSGGAIIAWHDMRNGNYDIYAQRVDPSGVKWSTNGVTVCTESNGQYYPKMTSDGAGGAIVTWKDSRSTDPGIYAQRVDASGVLVWASEKPICTTGSPDEPVIAGDGAGGAIIAWDDYGSGTSGIYAQRVDASGGLLWSSGVPVCTIGDPDYPAMTSDGAGGVIIAWEDYRSGTNYDIYAQRVDASGNTKWGVNGTEICWEGHNQQYPQVVNNDLGEAIFIWEDNRNDGNRDIYAQRVNPSGLIQWEPDTGVPICTAGSNQQNLAMIDDGSGGAIITWDDLFWVYAQRIYHDGALVAPPESFSWEIFLPAILKEH